MSKTILGILLAVVSVGLIGGIVYTNNKNDDTGHASSSAHSDSETPHPEDNAETTEQAATSEPAGANAIEIKDYTYGPKTIKVKVGETVTWTNQDSVKHDITPDTESADFKASELLGKGESYSFTFTKAGTYSYKCSPHPYMKATVEVTE